MAVKTNNIRPGLYKGMGKGITGSILGVPEVQYGDATPDEILTGQSAGGSDLYQDTSDGELYMVEAAGGSEWIRLISGT